LAGAPVPLVALTADNYNPTSPTFWLAGRNGSGPTYGINIKIFDVSLNLLQLGSVDSGLPLVNNITTTANNGVCSIVYEIYNQYNTGYFPAGPQTDYIQTNTWTRATATAGTPYIVARGVGLASKAFSYNNKTYFLSVYAGAYQPTFFLMDINGNVICKLAYSNAGGYITSGVLPSVNLNNDTVQIGYLYKDLVQSVNKTQATSYTPVSDLYTQNGANLAAFTFGGSTLASETASTLQLSGGFIWQYDGVKPVELGFHLYPEDVQLEVSGLAGSMSHRLYYYQVVYAWTDAQGNIHRSAPSIPSSFNLTTGSAILLQIPTLRETYKTGNNPVRIEIYRWSTAQPVYYSIYGASTTVLNDPTVDAIALTDQFSDAQIIGNHILYTTGGVLENIAAPATNIMTLYQSSLFAVDAEDPNLLWFSKQII
jgi:hypothetical protein